MLPFFKRFMVISLTIILSVSLNAQDDTVLFSETDSLQDIQINHLNQQIRAVRSLLKKNILLQELISDSLKAENEAQTKQVDRLSKESDLLIEKLAAAFKEIEESDFELQESKKSFRTIYFITVPVLLLVALSVLAVLLVLLARHKNSTNAKIIALRKYTYEGIEEVRADYIGEIKRRVKKITSRLKGKGKKGSKKGSKKGIKKQKDNSNK